MDYKSLILWLVFEMLQVRLVLSYDGYNSCSKAFRHSRKLDLPCDLRTQSYCTIPGAVYPSYYLLNVALPLFLCPFPQACSPKVRVREPWPHETNVRGAAAPLCPPH
uniref:Secreted protein n=1 Tax=Cacopsylla melanoneura TaxID=428564 RepID=A0A8D9E727_9HEMI